MSQQIMAHTTRGESGGKGARRSHAGEIGLKSPGQPLYQLRFPKTPRPSFSSASRWCPFAPLCCQWQRGATSLAARSVWFRPPTAWARGEPSQRSDSRNSGLWQRRWPALHGSAPIRGLQDTANAISPRRDRDGRGAATPACRAWKSCPRAVARWFANGRSDRAPQIRAFSAPDRVSCRSCRPVAPCGCCALAVEICWPCLRQGPLAL